MAIEGGRISWSTGVDLGGLKKGLKEASNFVKKSALGAVWDTSSFVAGMKMSKAEVKNFGKEVSRLRDQFEDLRDMRVNMQKTGLWDSFSADARKAVDEAVDIAKTQAKAYNRTFRAMRAGNAVKNFFGGAWNKFGKIIDPIRKKIANFGKEATRSFGMGARRLLGIATAGAIVYKALQYMREGFANLTKADAQTRKSVNQLKGALMGLKNALGAAFAPIVNAIAPILTKFIGMLTSAANAVASFISALLGKKYVVVANTMGSVSDGISDIGGSASDANDKAKELQRTLMGFDKINKLDSQDKSSGGSGGSGGSSSPGSSGGGFSIVPVDDTANAWADKFRESWEKADFEWLGTLLGEKLRDALNKIPWDKIEEGARKLALSFTSFLRGFLTVDGLAESIGNTVAGALNTGITFAKTFVDTAPWEEFGQFVADGVNAFVKKARWKDLGHTISGAIVGVLKSLNSFFSSTDWEAVGSAIVKFFEGIQWGELFMNALTLIGNIASGVLQMLKGAFRTAVEDLQSWINSDKPLKNIKADVEIDTRPKWAIHIEEDSFDTPDTNFWLAIDEWLKKTRKSLIEKLSKGFTGLGIKLDEWLIPDAGQDFYSKIEKSLSDTRKKISDWWANHKPEINFNVSQTSAISTIASTWGKIKNGAKKTITFVAKKKGSLSAKFIETIRSAWSKITTLPSSKTIKLISSGISNAIAKSINTISKAWSKLKSRTASLKIDVQTKISEVYRKARASMVNSKIKAVSAFGKSLPALAQGGVVEKNTPRLAIIGDNKHESEIVAPESKLESMAKRVANETANSGNAQIISLLTAILEAVNGIDTGVYLDGEQIKNNVVRRINNHTRATGQLEIIV